MTKPKRIVRRMPPIRYEHYDLSQLNHTELLNVALFNGIPGACHGVSREVLLDAVESMKAIEIDNPMDSRREKLYRWLKRYWGKLAMQVAWEAPEDVFQDSDVEVALFWVQNEDQIM